MANRTEFKHTHYIIKELGSGSYGDAHASIPKSIADSIIANCNTSRNPLAIPKARAQLRAALEATKICKAGKGFHGKLTLESEISVLASLNKTTSPNIVHLIRADSLSNQWLTLELLDGGTLSEFSPEILPPASLAWHMLFQLSEVCLALHFGYTSGKGFVPNFQKFAHTDIAPRNIMFRTKGSFEDYPDIVLVDFGSAEKVLTKATDGVMRYPVNYRGVDHQAVDLKNGVNAVERIFAGLLERDERLKETLGKFSKWRPDDDDSTADDSLLKCLIQLRDQAWKARKRCYEPLPAKIVQYFEERAEVVSDKQLGHVFPDLA